MKHKPPYLTQGEIIRALAKALGTKSSNKKIDDYARGGDVDGHYLRSLMIDKLIFNPIDKSISKQFAHTFREVINFYLDGYVELVKKVALDGMPRERSLPLLIEHFFSLAASGFLLQFFKFYRGVVPEKLIAPNVSAVVTTLEFIGIEHKKWGDGNTLPSFNSIAKLKTSEQNKCLLLIARAVDSFRESDSIKSNNTQKVVKEKSELETKVDKIKAQVNNSPAPKQKLNNVISLKAQKRLRLCKIAFEATRKHLLATNNYYDNGRPLSLALIEYNNHYYTNIRKNAFELYPLISWTKNKSKDIQQQTRSMLDGLRVITSQEDPNNLTTYFIDWCEAKWHLFSGDIGKANYYYNEAFNSCLYSAGENQLKILEEALIVAAKLEDKPFLKRLKNQAVSFGMHGKPSDKKELVQDWEIKEWAGHFKQKFPQDILFEGIKYECDDFNIPMIITEDNLPEPDFRNPNRVFHTIVEGRRKSVHQLVWFTMNNEPDIVERLLKEGAKVDIESKSGETPIMMALQHLSEIENVFGVTDKLFNLISVIDHKKDTLNIKTKKKRFLPIIFAVESGEIEVLLKILEMGADIDARGKTDNRTALYHTLVIIDAIKNHEQYTKAQINNLNHPSAEGLESIRRYSSGLSGISLNHQKVALNEKLNDPLFIRIMIAAIQIESEKVMKLNIDKMREIASTLIENDADIYAEHTVSDKTYTPLSFAEEIGEDKLFKN